MNVRHRRWYRQANGPLPDPLPTILRGVCPGYEKRRLSCTDYPTAIYLNRWDVWKRRVLYHETTHWFDMQYLTNQDREDIRAHYSWPLLPWWYQVSPEKLEAYDPNCERLAWAGEEMYLHPRKYRWLRQKMRACKQRGTVSEGTPS